MVLYVEGVISWSIYINKPVKDFHWPHLLVNFSRLHQVEDLASKSQRVTLNIGLVEQLRFSIVSKFLRKSSDSLLF